MEPRDHLDPPVKMEQMVQQDLLDPLGQWGNKVNREHLEILANVDLMVTSGPLDPLENLDWQEPLVSPERMVSLDHWEIVDFQDLLDFSAQRDHLVQMAREDWTVQRVILVNLVPTASKVWAVNLVKMDDLVLEENQERRADGDPQAPLVLLGQEEK